MGSQEEPANQSGLPVEGILYSFTTVYVGPKDLLVPYLLGWVDTEAGRLFTRIKGHPQIGMPGKVSLVSGEGWWFECQE